MFGYSLGLSAVSSTRKSKIIFGFFGMMDTDDIEKMNRWPREIIKYIADGHRLDRGLSIFYDGK